MTALLICAISIVSLVTVLSGCSTEPAAENSSSAHEAPATSSEEAKDEPQEEAEKAKEEAEKAKEEADKQKAEEAERESQEEIEKAKEEAQGGENAPGVGPEGGKSAEGPGSYNHAEDSRFCSEHQCIGDFTGEDGYVVECSDGSYSHAGGISGVCSHHGGESG